MIISHETVLVAHMSLLLNSPKARKTTSIMISFPPLHAVEVIYPSDPADSLAAQRLESVFFMQRKATGVSGEGEERMGEDTERQEIIV